MTGDSLFTAAPGFDQPLAVLKHCHDRIRKQLATLDKLLPHLQQYGADQQAQEAAQAVLRYFMQAAPLHHEDEEHDQGAHGLLGDASPPGRTHGRHAHVLGLDSGLGCKCVLD
mgnify:CR=1 FL=1